MPTPTKIALKLFKIIVIIVILVLTYGEDCDDILQHGFTLSETGICTGQLITTKDQAMCNMLTGLK